MRIALFGGTFDPIHSGHVRLAKEFASRLGFDRVLLMPTFVPPHKLKDGMAPAEDRLAMCRLAAEGEPLLEVSDLEIRRGGSQLHRRHSGSTGGGISGSPVGADHRGGYVPDPGHVEPFPRHRPAGPALRRTPAPCHDGAAADLRRGAGAAGGSLRPCGAGSRWTCPPPLCGSGFGGEKPLRAWYPQRWSAISKSAGCIPVRRRGNP